MKRIARIACTLPVLLSPSICMAEAGQFPDLISLFTVVVLLAGGWTVLSVAVFFLLRLRGMPRNKRIAYSLMLWFSPAALAYLFQAALLCLGLLEAMRGQ